MYEPTLTKTDEGPTFRVAQQPANLALNILESDVPPMDSDLAFDPENPAEWQPAVAAHAEAFIKSISPEELAQMGDFAAVAEEFLILLAESSRNPVLLDRTMRAMIRIDQKQLRPILLAELQKAAKPRV